MTSNRPDLYAILGVSPNATQVEISRAYRALLRRHHPDTRGSADDQQGALSDTTLQEVLAAYTVLRDPARRADYDRHARPQPPQARRRAKPPLDHHDAYPRPPIVAGPVRWHRAP